MGSRALGERACNTFSCWFDPLRIISTTDDSCAGGVPADAALGIPAVEPTGRRARSPDRV